MTRHHAAPKVALAVSLQLVVHPDRTEESGVAKLHLSPEPRMNIHKNARLTPLGRAKLASCILERGKPVAKVARDFHVYIKDRSKMGGTEPRGGRGAALRSVIAAASPA